jgi:hypothetical protein
VRHPATTILQLVPEEFDQIARSRTVLRGQTPLGTCPFRPPHAHPDLVELFRNELKYGGRWVPHAERRRIPIWSNFAVIQFRNRSP